MTSAVNILHLLSFCYRGGFRGDRAPPFTLLVRFEITYRSLCTKNFLFINWQNTRQPWQCQLMNSQTDKNYWFLFCSFGTVSFAATLHKLKFESLVKDWPMHAPKFPRPLMLVQLHHFSSCSVGPKKGILMTISSHWHCFHCYRHTDWYIGIFSLMMGRHSWKLGKWYNFLCKQLNL